MKDSSVPNLNLKDVVLNGQPGQAYWTVGNTADCDIIIPKANICFDPLFAIIKLDKDYYLLDLNINILILNSQQSRLVKIDQDKPVVAVLGYEF